ncbi:prolyl oligopeptidase family serine peptidase [Acidicapsa dinghuensis]|uniref:prolyl oligopeptidase n=1 Tax=Acidicapsa dinghuensis TaxID=2218256 RepID=A0ABW1EED0_9BACT|nr:prolyl oligopeptidase family serine peptidase [Acidicapsa dinghuensis]
MSAMLDPSSYRPEAVYEVLHGIEVEDTFRWLEEQDSLATRAFIRSEQEAYRKYLHGHDQLRSSIEERVMELLSVEVIDLPISDRHGGLLYLRRRADEEQKALYHRNDGGMETLLLTNEILGRDSNTSLAILQVSPDGRYLAFALRIGGEDVQEIAFYDLDNGLLLPDSLPRGFYRGLVFDNDGSGFHYVHEEIEGVYQTRRAARHHRLGEASVSDSEVFYAGDGPSLRLIIQGSENGCSLGYTVVSLESASQTRFFFHEAPFCQPPRKLVDLEGRSFSACLRKDSLEAMTTHDAPLGRIVSISLERPEPKAWDDLVPQSRKHLHAFEHWNDSLVAHYLDGCEMTTRLYSATGEFQREIHYPPSGTSRLGQLDTLHGRLFYSHSDITAPPSIYAIDLKTGASSLWWRQSILPTLTEPDVEERSYPSVDGVNIPITLIRPSGCLGPRPTLLSAYGAAGVNNTPKFSALLTILIEAGFSCAIAHVRGGGEGGRQWHLAAQKQHKQTSVNDLIAAAEWLMQNNYTASDHLGIAGQSDGALLALCAVTQRPALFRAAMALGPLADLVRFHLFGVARGFVREFGSPDDPEEFAALYELSPYHRVVDTVNYPAVLIISGDRDKRCDSLHARKMIARLHQSPSSERPVLLDYSENRGHKPVLPLTERIRALTARLTFLIAELGMVPRREIG